MRITQRTRTSRKLALSLVAAISMMVVLTAVAAAGSQGAKWSGVGQVLFAGPSQDPAAPTTTESRFKMNKDGSVKSVKVNTSNELVVGVLGDGAGGSAITECKARRGNTACDDLALLLTGAQVTSFHNSEATLSKVTQEMMPFPGIGEIEVLHGQVRGKLSGVFTLSNATGAATGTAQLKIGKGSIATYACFGPSPVGPIPTGSLQPCIDNTGAQLFPIFLDVQDKGKFEIGEGVGSMSDILGLKGKVEVHAISNPLMAQFGGSIVISNAKASLVGDDGDGDGGKKGDDEDDEDDEEDEDDD